MVRRRRGRRKGSPNTSVILAQIVGLGLILVMILFFRDQIAGGAGKFLDSMGASEDVQVSGAPAGQTGEDRGSESLGSEGSSDNAGIP